MITTNPLGLQTITPYLIVKNGSKAIEFYKQAFGANEALRMTGPNGEVAHAELKIGSSTIMLSDEVPGGTGQSPESLGSSSVRIFMYVEDVDSTYQQALRAGAQEVMAPADMFWGDRFAKLQDPFGHLWGIATHNQDVSPEERERRTLLARNISPAHDH